MTEQGVWEDYIALENSFSAIFQTMLAPKAYEPRVLEEERWQPFRDEALSRLVADEAPLPMPEDREGYYGNDHFAYWASGLYDWLHLRKAACELHQAPRRYLDIGCASGRVLRHAALDRSVAAWGCDISRRHVDWCNTFLPQNLSVFQNTSIPTLPLESNYFDLVSAYSVFTHIESFETTWLTELRRILKPGGIAWLTIHSDHTLAKMRPDWPLYNAVSTHPKFVAMNAKQEMNSDRMIFRWHHDKSYSGNVFYRRSYIERAWGRIMKIRHYMNEFPQYQDVVILQK